MVFNHKTLLWHKNLLFTYIGTNFSNSGLCLSNNTFYESDRYIIKYTVIIHCMSASVSGSYRQELPSIFPLLSCLRSYLFQVG